MKQLEEAKLVTIIPDKAKREWVCLMGEIEPLVIFPEYIMVISEITSMFSDDEKKTFINILKKLNHNLDNLNKKIKEKI